MAIPATVVIAGVAIALAVTRKAKTKVPEMLSADCGEVLMPTDETAITRWQNRWISRHPPPPAPSDPDTLRGWIAEFVSSFMKETAPHCTYLFQVSLGEWPGAARYLFERLVYGTALWLEIRDYNVVIPSPPIGP